MDLIEQWMKVFCSVPDKPKWRTEFEFKISELKYRTGLTERELLRVADAIEELRIIDNQNR